MDFLPGSVTKDFQALPGDLFIYKFFVGEFTTLGHFPVFFWITFGDNTSLSCSSPRWWGLV